MPKLKTLSGKDIIKIMENFGFVVVSQKGSHIKLQKENNDTKQTLTIPNHRELDKGTLKAIYNQISNFIQEDELKNSFYNK